MKSTLFQTLKFGKINAETGIIHSVSIITVGPAKGHYYYSEEGDRIPMVADETTLQQVRDAIAAFGSDGMKVKADHWSGFDAIVGAIKDPVLDGKQLRGDLHLLLEDDSYERIIEMAEKMPSQFGLSIAFSGTPEIKSIGTDLGTQTQVAVARITELYSVDLVDDPAANPTGLFSAAVDFKEIDSMTLTELIPSIFGKDGTVTELQTTLATTRANLSAAQAEIKQLKDANTASALDFEVKITNLTGERDKATKERDEFKAIIDKPDGEIEKRAGLKANEILASFGHKPLETKPGNPGGTDIIAQHAAIKDAAERMAFYRKNRDAYDLAFKAANAEPPKL